MRTVRLRRRRCVPSSSSISHRFRRLHGFWPDFAGVAKDRSWPTADQQRQSNEDQVALERFGAVLSGRCARVVRLGHRYSASSSMLR